MREILFRGKRVDNGKWVYGQFTATMHARSFITPDNICQYDASILFVDDDRWCRGVKIDEQTVGQYTGMKDKHGKKIFEGDIVLLFETNSGVVVYDDNYAGFVAIPGDGCGLCVSNANQREVIGNIHDNPELMGGAENVSHP